jgi:hypothetical protein
METTCRTVVLSCIDYRIVGAAAEWLGRQGLLGACDWITAAGAARNLASPRKGGDREFVLDQIALSHRLRPKTDAILINHQDCGGYGGARAFSSEREERRAHEADLQRAAEVVRHAFPEITVRLVYARIDPARGVTFEEVALAPEAPKGVELEKGYISPFLGKHAREAIERSEKAP